MARLPALFVVQDGVAVVQDGVAIVADTPTVDHETIPVSEGTGIFITIEEVAEGMIRIALVMDSNALATRTCAILGIVSLVFFAGCGGGTASTSNPTPAAIPNPVPTITAWPRDRKRSASAR